jgi:transcription antitermination factor NusG
MEKSGWFAVHVRPRFEHTVSLRLQQRDIEHYLPCRRISRPSAKGTRSIEVPLLPGYIFCKADSTMYRSLLTIPGILDLTGSGVADAAIFERKISDLKRIIEVGLTIRPWPFTPAGKKVTVGNGPLKGVSGILDNTSAARLLIVSIDPIQRSLAVEVGHHHALSFSAGVGTAA